MGSSFSFSTGSTGVRGTRHLFELLLITAVVLMTSCGQEAPGNDEPPTRVVRQPIVDTDADGLDDGWETDNFGDLSQGANGDPDADDMTNLEEYENDLDPNVKDAFDDTDGDRYPNIYEVRGGADPHDVGSTPAPTYVVAASGGTHTTIAAAISAANVANGAYQIIAIAPGTYAAPGGGALLSTSKPKLLVIGVEGAAKTIVQGGTYGFYINNDAVISSLTVQGTQNAFFVYAPYNSVYLNDVLVRNNNGTLSGAGLYQSSDRGYVYVMGSTFLDNLGAAGAQQIYANDGNVNLKNTLVWSTGTGTMIAKSGSGSLTTNYCLVKGKTLTGTGNLPGSTDPKLRPDGLGHILWDSPLRAAGGSVATSSRVDIDGEARPSGAPDIGVDQFVDSDSDDLPDYWEIAEAGDLTTLTSRAQDADSDGLSNELEYFHQARPLTADSDGDGLTDGAEVTTHGTNPILVDTDGDEMPDAWEVAHGLAALTVNGFEDADGDRYPNIYEYVGGTDPTDADSTPAPTYVVAASGGTHTTIAAAISAAKVTNGAYQIIAIAPGTYAAPGNGTPLSTSKPRLLVIGVEGAAKTIVQGGMYGFYINNDAVISSLTVQGTHQAFTVNAPYKKVYLNDVLVRNNGGGAAGAGLYQSSDGGYVYVTGSTFLDNVGEASSQQIYTTTGVVDLKNTLVWSTGTGTMIAKAGSGSLTTNYCLVKGKTLTGTGNLPGSTDPKLRPDGLGHILWDSLLRAAGGSVATSSRVDIDGEVRPSNTPDIGVDQFVDADSDDLPDYWELAEAGDLTTLTSRAQDADGDGLSNELEYFHQAKPLTADSDGDGLTDGAEVTTHGTNPILVDTDGDDMPDGWEVTHGLAALTVNGFDDADGDRYPNIYEYVGGADPTDADSMPMPTYAVAASGGTHTTIAAAINAAKVTNGAYQIIAIAPGTYAAPGNGTPLSTSKPKLLVIGVEGAAKTIVQGGTYGFYINNDAVISSLTVQGTQNAFSVDAPSKNVYLNDVLARNNGGGVAGAGLYQQGSGHVHVTGSTFLDNIGAAISQQIYTSTGVVNLENTLVWSAGTGTMIAKAGSGSLTTNYCLVKGHTLTGTGNLPGSMDPKLRPDGLGHILWDSPLRAAGGSMATSSRVDIDGEVRPSNTPDIGIDQFVDSDSDDLPDYWELAEAGDLTTLTSRAQDADGDGLSNELEYFHQAKPLTADSDGDGLADGAEVTTHGTSPILVDTDGDEMPDAWEVAHGLSGAASNAFEDADGDRYPNIYEYVGGTDPADADSTPAPTYVVDGMGGGTHTTIAAAITAANIANGAYQIIAIAPGTYASPGSGTPLSTSKPKLLVIGVEGAAKTIVQGETYGFYINNDAVISSLTVQGAQQAFFVYAPYKKVYLNDVLVRNNNGTSLGAGLYQYSGWGYVYVTGSTFLDNVGSASAQQIYAYDGNVNLKNTLVWGAGSGTMIAKGGAGSLTTNYCLVKGQTLTGTGNLSGSTDPKLRPRGSPHLRADSPLRAAGGSAATSSRVDFDGEPRPSSTPDIGVDQYVDADADGLPDEWEFEYAGGLATLSGGQDPDGDGVLNEDEALLGANPLDPDTDRDGVTDGVEIGFGMNPVVSDADELGADHNGDGVIDALNAQIGGYSGQSDTDGDGYSNASELLACTDVLRPDTDGDGYDDDVDAFPLDPLLHTLPTDGGDVTGPLITLTAPWYAIAE